MIIWIGSLIGRRRWKTLCLLNSNNNRSTLLEQRNNRNTSIIFVINRPSVVLIEEFILLVPQVLSLLHTSRNTNTSNIPIISTNVLNNNIDKACLLLNNNNNNHNRFNMIGRTTSSILPIQWWIPRMMMMIWIPNINITNSLAFGTTDSIIYNNVFAKSSITTTGSAFTKHKQTLFPKQQQQQYCSIASSSLSSPINYRCQSTTTARFASTGQQSSDTSSSSTSKLQASSAPVITIESTEDSSITSTDIVKILAKEEEFIKPERDQRQYRAIQLGNNLQVLLVSDQMSTGIGIEAGSVHVQAGHFDDTIPGLAHFHEHMLFLGTKKYPEEDDYEDFLSQYGGFSNAYTDMEDTNYYFSVTTDASECQDGPSEALYGALDRLAQFFIAPTFDRNAVDREIKAIDSEYRNGKTSDSWRNFQLIKSIANPDHPFSKFGCGNYETLMSRGLDHLLTELDNFWNTYYRTYNLRLTVVGHSPLDILQQAVVETFGQLPYSTGEHRRTKNNPNQVFPRENAVYGGYDAFSVEGQQLRKIRYIKPLTEIRNVKFYFRTPPIEDPVLRQSKPYAVTSHILGHEGPGSLHAILNEEGYINSLSSGMAVDTADFSLFQVSISLTPKGLANKDIVMDLVFQYIALLKENKSKMEAYHTEMKQIAAVNFKFRENGDPTDFCASASELLFEEDLDPARILTISSDTADFEPNVAQSFLDRLTPSNCMISIISSDLDETVDPELWTTEKWYGASYKEEAITDEKMDTWTNPPNRDSRLRLPELNKYIPTDFSLKCLKEENGVTEQQDTDLKSVPPVVVLDTPRVRLWHKMDQYWRVPKTFVKAAFLSPATYSSPRSMTLNRIYQRMLNDDLNSFVYDASIAGCNYRVSCTPQGYRLSVRGYSEKIQFLLETLTSRMLSLIEEMKTNDPTLEDKFQKAKESLLRETKNYRLDPPYEVASYNARLLIEEGVWYLDNYVDLMEGDESARHPLTMYECACAAEECLTGSIKCEAICMGNIDEKECYDVADVLDKRFVQNSRILNEVEIPRFRSVRLPTRDEAIMIFGPDVAKQPFPVVYQELAYTETEENNAVEIILQVGSEFEMGYEGLAILDLVTHMAYTSAFGQLRTKEQLGYIVSAHARKTAGGAWGMSLVVQSSVADPEVLEERCEAWIETFRTELQETSPESYAREASSVVSQLLESDTKLSQEVGRVWGEILNTEGLVDRLRTPAFDRLEKVAQELIVQTDGNNDGTKTPEQLKTRVLEFFDKHFRADSPNRRTLSSRVYSHSSKEQYEATLGKPGVLSTYSDMRYFKQFLGTHPTVPYWRIEKQNSEVNNITER